jgi:hypothetical protein
MGDKKDENDNWSGTPKFVQKRWGQQKREAARVKKNQNLKNNKATNKDGKGKR